ncbi:sodium:dicarboxylate symporter [Chromatium okenii]|uniref:cation:dicarboxylate symporter family transporter n=1 Tax=Chromatium okenii TaxID=61644 RepID=UPI0019048C35|nr:sodium:dicarboxylate symporter [Chromatium okenii]
MYLRQFYSVPTALILGIALALLLPSGAPAVAWLGHIFISLLKLLILPLILVSIYSTLASSAALRHIGGRTFGYYVATSAVAALTGTVLGLTFAHDLPTGLLHLEVVITPTVAFNVDQLINQFIPSNVFASLAAGNVLHIVVIAISAALATRQLTDPHRLTLINGAQALDALLMQALNGVLAIAPLGITALVYSSLATLDWAEIFQLQALIWAIGWGVIIHAFLFMPLLYWLRTRRSPWQLLRASREPLATAFSTASSSATYPVSKRALEDFGVSEQITSLTLPLGATLNMHGSAIYQAILLIFMSQLAGVELTALQAGFIVLLTMASSAGTAGIPGGGIAMMAFMLTLLGLPPTYLALYLIVDRFFDYPITAVNVWGDLVIAAIVDVELKTTAKLPPV